ncbi:MAG TPA: OmpA family protein [Saprospiraceae bacterium]|nr:OmpA family protein [Saprospiraceae bacterium]HPN69548.1 OmpA family protein [Saprospiraceae bacterium]
MMKSLFVYFLAALMVFSSCNTSKKTQGAIIGGAVGATAGGLLTKKNRAVGIILGAAVGGLSGGVIGSYMDKAARDISDDLGNDATVVRVGEGIVVSFDSGLLFDFDSYALKSTTKENLSKLAASLTEYKDTKVNILGHTDSDGDSAYNQKLSVNRSNAVLSFLTESNVSAGRLNSMGYGESDPVSTNKTDDGKKLNRRVEIVLVADEQLKKSSTTK